VITSRTVFRLALGGCVVVFAACANKPPPPLYLWEGFPKQQYETLLRTDGGVPSEQLLAMLAHADKARGLGTSLPPGFRAHLGMLKLSSGDAGGAREAWLAEKAAFPESAPYMDQLLKRLEAPRAASPKENPT
jgi:hypothetical protein